MITDTSIIFAPQPPPYPHKLSLNATVDGQPYQGNLQLFAGLLGNFIGGGYTETGFFSLTHLPPIYSAKPLAVIALKDGRPFSSEMLTADNTVIYDVAINTQGGSAPTGDPAIITGTVERILDNQAVPVPRQVVAIEQRPDGSWKIGGAAVSDEQSGHYQIDLLTDHGDVFVLALDEYGEPFTAGASLEAGAIIHPSSPNGFVYRAENAGQLPAAEPVWWPDTGTTHTRTLETGLTMRALVFYRPLAHGPIAVALSAQVDKSGKWAENNR